jgi:hypothetical protein
VLRRWQSSAGHCQRSISQLISCEVTCPLLALLLITGRLALRRFLQLPESGSDQLPRGSLTKCHLCDDEKN